MARVRASLRVKAQPATRVSSGVGSPEDDLLKRMSLADTLLGTSYSSQIGTEGKTPDLHVVLGFQDPAVVATSSYEGMPL
ncbi:hypothetical protein HAX54_012592 [Datura stramonium]|uniref:Uncharacterized protein n=1 Tax=Datura stramonium TaxID=4076 RepID=A0ABS8TJZ7_DATST|nr:hypothetical protein [Datura stramonium]